MVHLERPTLEQGLDGGDNKLARALGSVDNPTREKGLEALARWLSRQGGASEEDVLKIWKGVFYCFWHADKARFQEDLAERLASILHRLQPEMAHRYFAACLLTMRREWFGIDRLRLDKFMMLVRKMVRHMFIHFQKMSWNLKQIRHTTAFLEHDILLATDENPAAGLNYHLADVWVPELVGVCQAGERAPSKALRQLLEPLCQAMAQTQRPAFMQRISKGAIQVVAEELRHPSEHHPLKHLKPDKVADHLFQMGAEALVPAKNRQALYAASRQLMHAAKQRSKHFPEGGDAEQGVPLLNGSPAAQVQVPAHQKAVKVKQAGSRQKGLKRKLEAEAEVGPGELEASDGFAREAVQAVQQATGGPATPGVKAHLAGAGEAAPLQVKQFKGGQRERERVLIAPAAAPEAAAATAAAPEVAAGPGQCSKKQRRQAQAAALQASPLQKGSPVAAANGISLPAANVVVLTGVAAMAPGVVTPPFLRARRAAATPPQRKKVNFVLSRNSHHLIGKQMQPVEVPVTSPDAQPKKSALKPGTVEAMQKMQAQQQAAAKSTKRNQGNKRRRQRGAA